MSDWSRLPASIACSNNLSRMPRSSMELRRFGRSAGSAPNLFFKTLRTNSAAFLRATEIFPFLGPA